MLAHNALRRVQAKARSLTDAFRGKERFKDVWQDFGRNARTVVGYLHHHASVITICSNTQLALAAHGINRIVDNVGPYLVELAAKRIHQKRHALIVALHRDSAFELV